MLPQGKGMWIWQILPVQQVYGDAHLDVDNVADDAVRLGLGHVVFKIATNLSRYNLRRPNPNVPVALFDDLIPALAQALQSRGVQAIGYAGVTENSIILPERNAEFHVERALQFNLNGLVSNAEGSYWLHRADRYTAAERYASRARSHMQGRMPHGLSTYRFIKTSQPTFPAVQFMRHMDYVKNQVYWVAQHNPVEQLNQSVAEWRQVTDKPIIPDGAAYTEQRPSYRMPDGSLWLPSKEDLVAFDAACKERGFSGYTLWDWYSASRHGLLDTIRDLGAYEAGEPPPPPEPKTLEERVSILEARVDQLQNQGAPTQPTVPIPPTNNPQPSSPKVKFNLSGNHNGPIDAYKTPGQNKQGSFGKHQTAADTGERHQGNDWMRVNGTLSNGKSGDFWISKSQATLEEA